MSSVKKKSRQQNRQELLQRLYCLRDDIKKLQLKESELLAKLITDDADHRTGFVVDDKSYIATIVRPTCTILDAARIEDTVSPTVWRRITDAKINHAKVERAVDAGYIDANFISSCIEHVSRKPYLLIKPSSNGKL